MVYLHAVIPLTVHQDIKSLLINVYVCVYILKLHVHEYMYLCMYILE